MASVVPWVSLLAVILAALLLADSTLAQTFSYSRGWKSGKRSGAAAPSGSVAADVLAEDLPLYRYFLESRGARAEHRAPFEAGPWRIVDEPVLQLRRPSLPVGQNGETTADHDDR